MVEQCIVSLSLDGTHYGTAMFVSKSVCRWAYVTVMSLSLSVDGDIMLQQCLSVEEMYYGTAMSLFPSVSVMCERVQFTISMLCYNV